MTKEQKEKYEMVKSMARSYVTWAEVQRSNKNIEGAKKSIAIAKEMVALCESMNKEMEEVIAA